jgi:hypothetical protein
VNVSIEKRQEFQKVNKQAKKGDKEKIARETDKQPNRLFKKIFPIDNLQIR